MADNRVINIKPVEWSGDLMHFAAVRTLIELRAVGLLCVHGTIINDIDRANYPAGNALSRLGK